MWESDNKTILFFTGVICGGSMILYPAKTYLILIPLILMAILIIVGKEKVNIIPLLIGFILGINAPRLSIVSMIIIGMYAAKWLFYELLYLL